MKHPKKFVIVLVSVMAAAMGAAAFADQTPVDEGPIAAASLQERETESSPPVVPTTTAPPIQGTASNDDDSPAPTPPESEAANPAPEISYPTQDEVGRAPASSDDVLATHAAFQDRKLAATGSGADDRDWWATTWHRTLESGATIFCVGSPTGSACHDDAYLPSPEPVMVLSVGGWPPEFVALVDADVTVTAVTVDKSSVNFDQVPLDVPSGRSIVAIPLPNRSVDVSVAFVADGREGTLSLPFTAEFTQEDLDTFASPAHISIEYGPTPGMAVGETTGDER